VNLLRAPGLIVKLLLVPDMPELVVKSVTPEPAVFTIIEPDQTPLEKTPVLIGLIAPVETLRELVPI